MSGIVGLATFDGSEVDRGAVEAMAAAAPHRGLDGSLAWHGAGAAFAYLRRRVLAAGSDKAGLAVGGGIVCVADARLDNRAALLQATAAPALRPGIAGEAEIILAAYRRWGIACAGRIVGDFAFVIWDAPRRTLLAARDPLGMRSLAYHVRPGASVAVATEIKQLLTLPHVPARLNEEAVIGDLVASFGAPDASFYEEIRNVAPGHVLVVDGSGSRVERFWAPDPEYRVHFDDEREYADLVRERFVDAVRARMRTDHPLGILLSGGVDSGSAASAAGWLADRGMVPAPAALHAFCWAFERFPQADERAVSSLITDAYGIARTDVPVDDAGPLAGFPEHGPDRDDPMLGAFQPAIEHSLGAARDAGVRVLLGGDRGDLVLGDTGWDHVDLALARRWRDMLGELREHRRGTRDTVASILAGDLIAPVVARARRRSPAGWLRWAMAARGGGTDHSPPWVRVSPPALPGSEATPSLAGFGFSRARRYDWIFTPLHVRGMAWSERTYARHGITFADPFSDRPLVELALALPQAVINRPGDLSKPLMRAAMEGIVPPAARARLAKVTPTPLYEHALRVDATATVRDLMQAPRIAEAGWVDAEAWRDHYETWLAGRGTLRGEWWWALGVEAWLRRHW
jgi:asparagine synthase (glutamine-hydrolysing)